MFFFHLWNLILYFTATAHSQMQILLSMQTNSVASVKGFCVFVFVHVCLSSRGSVSPFALSYRHFKIWSQHARPFFFPFPGSVH